MMAFDTTKPGIDAIDLSIFASPTPPVVGQQDPSVTELFEKDAVLFPKEVDRAVGPYGA